MARKQKGAAVVDPVTLGEAIGAGSAAVLAEEYAPSCPVFVLRADNKRHLHALIAAAAHLGPEELDEVQQSIREFELHQDARV